MLETRSQKLGQGQRTVYEQAKEAEVQNTVMDDTRADPQRVKKSGPTAGEKSIPNSRANTCTRTKEYTQQQGRARAQERQEHSQLQARTSSGRLAAAKHTAGILVRKGRSQDPWRDVTSVQDEDEDRSRTRARTKSTPR